MNSIGNIEQRNGQDFATLNNISITASPSCLEIDFKYQNVAPFINRMINMVCNRNWRIIKGVMDPSIGKYVGDAINAIVTPMLEENTIQDVYNMKCTR